MMQSFSQGSRAIGEAADRDGIKNIGIDTGAFSEALKIHRANKTTTDLLCSTHRPGENAFPSSVTFGVTKQEQTFE